MDHAKNKIYDQKYKVMGELTIIWLKALKVERISCRGILKAARLFWLDFCLISLAPDDFSDLVTCFGFNILIMLSLPGAIS
jgi:hypothetical protein